MDTGKTGNDIAVVYYADVVLVREDCSKERSK